MSDMNFRNVLSVFFACCGLALAQTPVTVYGAGYFEPGSIRLAPGQVTTLFLTGVPVVLRAPANVQRATQVPLPTSLAGFSATITQQPNNLSEQLPILSVEQDSTCADANSTASACVMTAITVQIPFDLIVDYGKSSPLAHQTAIMVTDSIGESNSFSVQLVPQEIHILTSCDASDPGRTKAIFRTACQPVVAHGDGTLVTSLNPAAPGEELVMYAFGLGATTPAVKAGAASPASPAVAQGNFLTSFAFRRTGGNPASESPLTTPNPVFVGLTPGQVGLYQVNFTVPATSDVPTSCSYPDQANLSVFLTSDVSPSMDVAQICVKPR